MNFADFCHMTTKGQSKIGKIMGMEAMIENMFYQSPVKSNQNSEKWLKFLLD